MNIHVPQSIEASYELSSLASVPTQIISPASSKPIIGAKQDGLVGTYILTRNKMRVDKGNLQNYLMTYRGFISGFPEPVEKIGKTDMYTGRQVYSFVLPRINFSGSRNNDEKISIVNGKLIEGTLSKEIIGTGSLLVKNIYNVLGKEICSEYFNNSQKLIMRFMEKYGFSIGVGDGMIKPDLKPDVEKNILQSMKEVHSFIRKSQQGVFNPDLGNKLIAKSLEGEIVQTLNKVLTDTGKLIFKDMSPDNRLHIIVDAGSKGTNTNIGQIMALVGQQIMDGERVPFGYTDRTLPHFPKYDNGALSRGFVMHSYMDGLDPTEYFFHAMGGRIGLIDTAIKTARSGYIQRKLIKSMEDLRVHYDGTVRNANSSIIQFSYGDDALNSLKLEKGKFLTISMTDIELEQKYRFAPKYKWQTVLQKPAIAEMKKDKNYQQKLDKEYQQIMDDRNRLREINIENLKNLEDISVITPFAIKVLGKSAINEFHIQPNDLSDLNPLEVLEQMNELIHSLKTYNAKTVLYNSIMLRTHFATKKIIQEMRLNKTAFQYLLESIKRMFYQSLVQPGEMVGPLAAQSIGEPSTQLTLNTFHFSGVGGKSVVTTKGVPRIEEILSVTQKIKTPSMTVYLKPEYAKIKEIAEKVKTDISFTSIGDLLIKTDFLYETKSQGSNKSEELEFINTYLEFNKIFGVIDTKSSTHKSPWVIRFEFDPEELLNRNITLSDIQQTIFDHLGGDGAIECIFNDDSAENLIMQVKISQEDLTDDSHLDSLRELERSIVQIPFRGMKNISFASTRKEKVANYLADGSYTRTEEYVVDTEGTNLSDIIANPFIDASRVYSNDIVEIYRIFGIEAARQAIIDELNEILAEYNTEYRHMALLSDTMTNRGILASINQHGVPGKLSESGTLAKASFEKTTQQLVESAIFSENDKIKGTSANIIMGQLPFGGTNSFDLVFDEERFTKLLEDPELEEDYEEYIIPPSQDTEDPLSLEKEIENLPAGDFFAASDLDFTVDFDISNQFKIGPNIETPKVKVNIIN